MPQLNCVRIPQGIDDLTVREASARRLGHRDWRRARSTQRQAWRIGLMGYGSRRGNVTMVLAAIETCLRDLGAKINPGAALAAASEVYGKA